MNASEAIGLENDLPENFVEKECSATAVAIGLLAEWVKRQKQRV